MKFAEAKVQYLKLRYPGFKFFKGIKTEFVICCELCYKKISGYGRMSKARKIWDLRTNGGNFHHKNGIKDDHRPENVQFLCRKCHRMLHRWGIIRRWMIKNGIVFEELPQADLKAWMPIF